jgi:hypothetical protein
MNIINYGIFSLAEKKITKFQKQQKPGGKKKKKKIHTCSSLYGPPAEYVPAIMQIWQKNII